MTPERYRRIGQVFDAVLEVPIEERTAYLINACDGDADLQRQVEVLLANHSDSETFLSRPAAEVAAQLLAENHTQFAAGKQISHYKFISPLGAGGMGEVYLAEDTRLKRKVALKVLPQTLAQDEERLLRFKQEAFAASALNHPNILTIYEFATEDEIHFLASEFIDGETVRAHFKREAFSLTAALDIAIQTAQALSAAHQAGIIHRDIKPENIMIRKDGIVKVLDFGLAKLVAHAPLDTEAETTMQMLTEAGAVLGTAPYMSPEQARGRAVDARTDIFSLGVVLYEMIAHHHPFIGETAGHTMVAILEKDPPPLSQYMKDAPEELERIIRRALAKLPDERYSSASELVADLKQLQKRLEYASELVRTMKLPPAVQSPTPVSQNGTVEQVVEPTRIAARELEVRPNSSTNFWLIGGLAVLVVIAIGIWQWPHSKPAAASPPIAMVIVPERSLSYSLTVDGNRDGKPAEFQSSGHETFKSGWKFKLNLISRQDGYLYLLNQDPNGNYRLLFPLPSDNSGSAYVRAKNPIQTGGYSFDDQPGIERFRLIWAADAVAVLERLRGLANKTDKGLISKEDDVKAVTDFLQQHTDPKVETSEDGLNKQTNVSGHGSVLVTLVELKHQ